MNLTHPLEPPVTPGSLLPPDEERAKIKTLVLYANGKRVPCENVVILRDPDGVGVKVVFETTTNCLAVGSGDPTIERAWGDKESGQLRYVRQPHAPDGKEYPMSGCVAIIDVLVPGSEGEPVRFRCRATTRVFDWTQEGGPLAETGEEITLDESWIGGRA